MMEFQGHPVKSITNNSIVIEWAIGNWCNFRCPYCFPDANTGTHLPPVVDDVLVENLKHLVKEIRSHSNDHIRWTLSGGEPTAQKKFSVLLETIQSIDKNSHVMLITNGTRPIAWWKKNVQYIKHMILSIHPESDTEHNVELIKLLADYDIKVSLSIMVGAQNFDQAVNSFKSFQFTSDPKYSLIHLKINRYRKMVTNLDFATLSNEQHMILDKLNKDHNNNKTTKFKTKADIPASLREPNFGAPARFTYTIDAGYEYDEVLNWYQGDKEKFKGNWVGYKCFAPSRSFHIDKSGKIGKLPCSMEFMNPLNIYNKDFKERYKYPTEPYICDKTYKDCNCAGVLEANKVL